MRHLHIAGIFLLLTVSGKAQQTKTEIDNRSDTFFIKHLYATEVHMTLPPKYSKYAVIRIDTLFIKDSLFIKNLIFDRKRLELKNL